MRTLIIYNGLLLVLIALTTLSWILTGVSAQTYLVGSFPIKKCTTDQCIASTRLVFEFPLTQGAFFKFRARNLELGERDIILNLTSAAIHCQLPCASAVYETSIAMTSYGSCTNSHPCPTNTCGTNSLCKTWDVKYNFGCWPLVESYMCFKSIYTQGGGYSMHTVSDNQCHLTGNIQITEGIRKFDFPIHEGSQTKDKYHVGINSLGHHTIFDSDAVIIKEGTNWFLAKQNEFCQFNVEFDCFGRVYHPSSCAWESQTTSVVHPKELVQITDVHPMLSSANYRISTRSISHFNLESKNLKNIFPGYVYTPEYYNMTVHLRPILSIFEHGEDAVHLTLDITDEFVGEIEDDLTVTFTMNECRQYDNDELHCNFQFTCKGSGKFRVYHEDVSKILSCNNNKFDQVIAFQTQTSEDIEICIDTDTNRRTCKTHTVEHIKDIIENTTIADIPTFSDHILNHPHFYTISGITSLSISGLLLLYLILGLVFKICFPFNLIKLQVKRRLAQEELDLKKKKYDDIYPEKDYREPIMTGHQPIYENTSGNLYPDVRSRGSFQTEKPPTIPRFSGFDM